jgi:hypothetical protein
MGLSKDMVLANGIPVKYHRVTSVNVITNVQNIVEVASYISEEQRRKQQADFEHAKETGEWPEETVFSDSRYLVAPYDQDMTVISAYEWLKTLPEFEGATDVIEFKEDGGGEAE